MKALIFNDKVVDVATTEFEVSPEAVWMDAPMDCKIGWHLEDEVLYPPDQEPAKTYDQQRASEYPPMADYLDGIAKGDTAQVDKYIADCLAVKVKYPKPE